MYYYVRVELPAGQGLFCCWARGRERSGELVELSGEGGRVLRFYLCLQVVL
jgi:hypothetical protein